MPPVMKFKHLYPTKTNPFSLLFSIKQLHLFHLSHGNHVRKYSLPVRNTLELLHIISTCSRSLFPPAVLVEKKRTIRDPKKEKMKNGERQAEGTVMNCDLHWTISQIFNPFVFLSSIASPPTSRILPLTIICIELALTILFKSFLFYKLSPATFPSLFSYLYFLIFFSAFTCAPQNFLFFSPFLPQSETDQDSC